ncbi:hypothetical protein B1R94_22360 [Mycolicibacterium litorale]|nr:hypothetical protein B1R94_22360 [Mycolicibacterium litorale]
MNMFTKTAAGAVLGGSLLVAGGFGLASAAPEAPAPAPQAQSVVGDGKVNVTLSVNGQQLGVIQDVTLTNAESLATAVCPGDDLASRLGELDTNQIQTLPVCASATAGLSYTFSQNGPGGSEVAPADNHETPSMAPAITSVMPAPPAAAETR